MVSSVWREGPSSSVRDSEKCLPHHISLVIQNEERERGNANNYNGEGGRALRKLSQEDII
ncbi:hypothetical protein AMTR_s03607p00008050 [Amborella trichopoda]|uniref:Uncharacterized protein n=1 Tax=Amborella trichopoda TaxID=13333 RepID=U5CWY5_AMBTC|nr:hypothetical protein AMTR_s03607p00008050 [Amborella trichopoda]